MRGNSAGESAGGQRPAVFLDRDGTLIEDRGHLGDAGDVVFFPDTVAALRRLRERFALFIVTNQPGVAEGTIAADDVRRVNDHVVARLAEGGVAIARVYVCPHRRTDGCACIKPNPHFLCRAAEEFGLDLRRSFVIGDHPHDVELARNAGATGIYVLTGHGRKHLPDLAGDAPIVPGIAEAVERVLTRVGVAN